MGMIWEGDGNDLGGLIAAGAIELAIEWSLESKVQTVNKRQGSQQL